MRQIKVSQAGTKLSFDGQTIDTGKVFYGQESSEENLQPLFVW